MVGVFAFFIFVGIARTRVNGVPDKSMESHRQEVEQRGGWQCPSEKVEHREDSRDALCEHERC